MEISNLPDIEFKKMVIRILKELSENFNKIASIKKVIETIKKNQSETKKKTPEIKNTLEGINRGWNWQFGRQNSKNTQSE